MRILREAGASQNIEAVCREKNISEVTFHRWKKELGQMWIPEAKRLKELERENTELKKMLADALLAKRVLEYVVKKKL
ncbi:MAG: transposase [Betaproteobacteria bacterium]|nr:transposase [Betaproteobacteria bacterium]